MEKKGFARAFLPILILFILTSVILFTATPVTRLLRLDTMVMAAGNLILFIATGFSFYLYRKSLANNNVQAFLRMIYSGMFIKMLICLFSALIYISIAGKGVNKAVIFGCMFLYFLYTFAEIWIIMKLSKQNRHA